MGHSTKLPAKTDTRTYFYYPQKKCYVTIHYIPNKKKTKTIMFFTKSRFLSKIKFLLLSVLGDNFRLTHIIHWAFSSQDVFTELKGLNSKSTSLSGFLFHKILSYFSARKWKQSYKLDWRKDVFTLKAGNLFLYYI